MKNPLGLVIESLYQGGAALRRQAHRRGWLETHRLPRPVISIGNLAFGGLGKTPVTIATAGILLDAGLQVAILSRGYGRRDPGHPDRVDGMDAVRFGDEPALIWAELGGKAEVVVGASRFRAGSWYLESRDCDVFLLDDGFQHVRLHRDLDIVIHHPEAEWLRESAGALRYADAVLVREGIAATVPVRRFDFTYLPRGVRVGAALHPIQWLNGRRVFAFSALGNNDQFFRTAAALGATVCGVQPFRDHHRYTEADFRELERRAGALEAEVLLTTAKDAVKVQAGERLAVLEIEAEMEPADLYRSMLLECVGSESVR